MKMRTNKIDGIMACSKTKIAFNDGVIRQSSDDRLTFEYCEYLNSKIGNEADYVVHFVICTDGRHAPISSQTAIHFHRHT